METISYRKWNSVFIFFNIVILCSLILQNCSSLYPSIFCCEVQLIMSQITLGRWSYTLVDGSCALFVDLIGSSEQ